MVPAMDDWLTKVTSNMQRTLSSTVVGTSATHFADEYVKAKLRQKLAISFYTFQLAWLYAIGLYKIQDDPTEEQLDNAKLNNAKTTMEFFSHCSEYFFAYLRSCKRTRWIYGLIAFPCFLWLFILSGLSRYLLPSFFSRRWNYLVSHCSDDIKDPRRIRDLALDVRPMVLGWMTLSPPAALLLMANSTLNEFLTAIGIKKSDNVHGYNCIRLPQYIDQTKRSSNLSFFHSPAFPIVTMAIFLLGIPTMIMQWFYFHLGMDPLFGYPSHDPQFKQVILQIQFYIMPLSWCLMALFFRSYFTYALSFVSREHDIEIYDDVIKSLPIKGWFRDFAFLRGEHIPFQIEWKNVSSVSYHNLDLPSEKLPNLPKPMQMLQRFTDMTEAISKNLELKSDFIEIKDKDRSLNIRLADLTKEQKAQLFFCIHKYAPWIHIDAATQEALVGSSVLKEPRYTEIWFDVLTSKNDSKEHKELTKGSTLHNSNYVVEENIGSGGQAVIYLAMNSQNEKVILKEYQLVPGESLGVLIESARAFENETTLLSQLSCNSIVKMKDMFYEDNCVFVVLEHVEGQNLRQLVEQEGALGENRVIDLALQMCDILTYLHGQDPPIVHRDFTPDNLILMPDGNLKLIDFSVAQAGKNVQSGECAGKHAYSPPEQFRGEACPQSDVYALGAMIHFLLTGKDPQPVSMSSPAELQATVSEQLSKLVERATKLNVAERCESAAWLKSELIALTGKPLPADLISPHPHEDGETETIHVLKEEERV